MNPAIIPLFKFCCVALFYFHIPIEQKFTEKFNGKTKRKMFYFNFTFF